MLEVGMKYEIDRVVTENDTAAKAASGSVEVLATPVMIAWMEEASLRRRSYNSWNRSKY